MTNQVNQAFMDFYNENKHLYTDTSPYGIMLTTFQAATQASERCVNKARAAMSCAETIRALIKRNAVKEGE